MNRCEYKCYRKESMSFEPEEWNKLNDVDKSVRYDSYMEWCGGVCYSVAENYDNKYCDNFDIQNLKDEDNLYKKLKGYICLQRRYIRHQNYPRPDFLTSDIFQENMNDFRQLLKENINEIIENLSMTKWINSIIKCFYDSGTSEEKSKALLLTSLLQLNRIDFDRTRSCYSADYKTSTNNKKWLVDNIIPLEDKNFDNIVSAFTNDKKIEDMIKVLKDL